MKSNGELEASFRIEDGKFCASYFDGSVFSGICDSNTDFVKRGWMNFAFVPNDNWVDAKSFVDADLVGVSVTATLSFAGLYEEASWICFGAQYDSSSSLSAEFRGIFHSIHFDTSSSSMSTFMVSSLYCSNIAGWYGINTQDLAMMVNNKLQNYEFLMHNELSYLENFGGKQYLI